MSSLFEILADVLESGATIKWSDSERRLDPAGLQSALNARHDEMDWPQTQWTIPIAEESRWPPHWKAAAAS
jgi:hypothetical protein